MLQSIVMLLRQIERRAKRRSRTNTSASCRGKAIAPRCKAMAEVFELRPYFEWRGLGFISQSALRIRDELRASGTRSSAFTFPACA